MLAFLFGCVSLLFTSVTAQTPGYDWNGLPLQRWDAERTAVR